MKKIMSLAAAGMMIITTTATVAAGSDRPSTRPYHTRGVPNEASRNGAFPTVVTNPRTGKTYKARSRRELVSDTERMKKLDEDAVRRRAELNKPKQEPASAAPQASAGSTGSSGSAMSASGK